MKSATDKLFDLFFLIRSNYQGILTKEDLSTIYALLDDRIEAIKKEEKELSLLGIETEFRNS